MMLDFLHNKNLVYRDLNIKNILLKSNGYICFLTASFVKELKPGQKTTTILAYPKYLAPEIILAKGYGKSVDWWALGIIIYELLVGIDPFHSDDIIEVYEKILKGKIKFPANFDRDAKHLIENLLNSDPKFRFGCLRNGARDIVEHRFFDNFKWKLFEKGNLEAPFVPTFEEGDNPLKYYNIIPEKEELPKELLETEESKAEEKTTDRRLKSRSDEKDARQLSPEEIRYLKIDPQAKEVDFTEDIFFEW